MVYGLLVWYTRYCNKTVQEGGRGESNLLSVDKQIFLSNDEFSQSSADMNCHIRAKTARHPSLAFIDQVDLV